LIRLSSSSENISRLLNEEYLAASEKKEKKIYQYAQKLDEIAAVIGKNNLIVRRFSPKSWKDGSIIHDFMHEIGLDVTEEFQELEESENLRLDKNTTEIKRILNKSEFLTEKEISYFRRFLKEISKDYIKEENTEMLAKEELQQFLELYAKENERVAEEYIGDGQPLFSNEVKDLPKWNPQNEKMQEEIIQFFAAVTMDLRRTNEIQRQKINQQEKRIRQLEKRANEFVMFRDKAKHPFRTVWKKLFKPIRTLSPSKSIVFFPIAYRRFSSAFAIVDFPAPDNPLRQSGKKYFDKKELGR